MSERSGWGSFGSSNFGSSRGELLSPSSSRSDYQFQSFSNSDFRSERSNFDVERSFHLPAGRGFSAIRSNGGGGGVGIGDRIKGCWGNPTQRRICLCLSLVVVIVVVVVAIVVATSGSKGSGSGGGGSDVVPVDSSTGGNPGGVTGQSSSRRPAISSSAAGPRPYNPQPWTESRLPDWLVPRWYNLTMTVDMAANAYHGLLDIEMDLLHNSNVIMLHAIIDTINTVSVRQFDGILLPVTNHWYNDTYDYYIILLANEISEQSSLRLTIDFDNAINTNSRDLSGFYAAYYEDASSVRHTLAATQFESIDARKAFPCFDEPSFKAVFEITIINNGRLWPTVLSNMPGVTQSYDIMPGWQITRFQPTPVMSTYLIAFVISDYQGTTVQAACLQPVTVTVWAPTHLLNSTIIPAEIAAKQISYYCSYFGVSYPLPKEDHIVIPQFAAGAMENWGLITYADYALLYNPTQNTVDDLVNVAIVVAHELAHQWFGNLVTAQWWSDLWLNEGFASYVEYIGADASNAELAMGAQFILSTQEQALAYDSSPAAHPIVLPDTATGSFSAITYLKGGSVIRMIAGIIGNDTFHTGIVNYLNAFSYRNAATGDMMGYLTQAAAANGMTIDVGSIMYEWVNQVGYPLLSCQSERQSSGIEWTCTQSRFFTYTNHSADDTRWEVYLTGITGGGTAVAHPMTPVWYHIDADSVKFTVPAETSWLKLNSDQNSFVRVNYDIANWEALAEGLVANHQSISVDDRIGLLDDSFVLAYNHNVDWAVWGNLTRYLDLELDPIVWNKAGQQLGFVYNVLVNSAFKKKYLRYVEHQMLPVAATVQWGTGREDIQQAYLAASVAEPLARIVSTCIGPCVPLLSLYQRWASGAKTLADIDPSIVPIMLEVGAMREPETTGINVLYQLYLDSVAGIRVGFTLEADRLKQWSMTALAAVTDSLTANAVIDWTLSTARIKSDVDAQTILMQMARSELGNVWVTRRMTTDFDSFRARFSNEQRLATVLHVAIGKINKQVDLDTIASVFDNIQPALSTTLHAGYNAGYEQAQSNIAWTVVNFPQLHTWITDLPTY